MSDNKFSTERTQSNTQDAAAAEELEREAKTGNDVTTYTHCFSSPFTFHSITEDVIKDTTVDTLTFNWGALTGVDYLEIEDELLMRGRTLVVPTHTGLFLCGMAVRACTLRNQDGVRVLDARAVKSMPIRDFRKIIDKRQFAVPGVLHVPRRNRPCAAGYPRTHQRHAAPLEAGEAMSNQNLARRTAVEVAFSGVDITKSIRPYLKAFTYTDNEADKADDIQIQLHDRDSIWMEKWLVEAIEAASAAKLKMDAVIVRENWRGDGKDIVLPCGESELDNVVLSGPPATITIKGTSLPFSAPVRQTKKNNDWENITLSAIARELAGANGMSCMYESAYDPFYKRVEQRQASDIEFLSRLSHDAGISLKATSSILVFFDQVAYEAKSPVITIKKGAAGGYIKYKLDVGAADSQYSSCRVSYVDPALGKCIEATAKIEDYNADAKNNQQLEVTANVSSKDEAKALAEKHLRLHNKYSKSATFTLPGNPALVAGVTVELKGWGAFDGKYIITQAVHRVGKSGYTTQIKLRRVLEGY